MDLIHFKDKVLTLNLYKKDVIIGIGSKVDDNNHILFLDLDNTTEKQAKDLITFIQGEYELGTALLLKSSENNHHGVFFDIIPFNLMIMIQKNVNLKHGCISELKGESTIRLSSKFGSKIEILEVILNHNYKYKQSIAHLRVFKENVLYNIPLNIGMFDTLINTNEVSLFNYEKRCKIW